MPHISGSDRFEKLLEKLRKQAKRLHRAVKARETEALRRVERTHPQFPEIARGKVPRTFKRSDAQLVIAREQGFPSWPRMVSTIGESTLPRSFRRVMAVVQSAAFRAAPEATLRKELADLEHPSDEPPTYEPPYVETILGLVKECPWLLKEEHAREWEEMLWNQFFDEPEFEHLTEDPD